MKTLFHAFFFFLFFQGASARQLGPGFQVTGGGKPRSRELPSTKLSVLFNAGQGFGSITANLELKYVPHRVPSSRSQYTNWLATINISAATTPEPQRKMTLVSDLGC